MARMTIHGSTPSPADPVPQEYDFLCEQCGYSLLGLTQTHRCPECGREFDAANLPLARVPWLYRIRIGRTRAYLKTIQLILRNPGTFAAELCRPVRISAADARIFRRTTIRLVTRTAALMILVVIGTFFLTGQVRGATDRFWMAAGIFSTVGLGALWIFLILATDMPTFIWRGLPANPSDLAPLHHYASAALILLSPTMVLAASAATIMGALPNVAYLGFILLCISALLGLVMLVELWRVPQIFMRAATGCSAGRLVMLAVYLPLHWALIGAMSFGLFLAIVVPLAMYLHL